MFALVSTVGTLCAEFPRGVMLFRTEGEAYEFAASLLVLYDKHVSQIGSDWEWQSGPSEDDRDQYRTAACLVSDWQDSLHPTEYFHVMHVLDLPQTVHELFLDRDHESFVRSIEQMNQMYRLQVSTIPTLTFVDNKSDGGQHVVSAAKRLEGFKKTLLGEIEEIDPIIDRTKSLSFDVAALRTHEPSAVFISKDGSKDSQAELLANRCRALAIDDLTSVADLLADIIVYCVSEMRKFGLPPAAIMAIVMESNKSKLQPDGSAKYDDNGKFLKGPNYFPPEPKLKELITELLEGQDPLG